MSRMIPRFALIALLSVIVTIVCSTLAWGQSSGDYRSVSSGDWNDPSIWEKYDGETWVTADIPPPSSTALITIMYYHTVTVQGGHDLTVDHGTVTGADNTATLIFSGSNIILSEAVISIAHLIIDDNSDHNIEGTGTFTGCTFDIQLGFLHLSNDLTITGGAIQLSLSSTLDVNGRIFTLQNVELSLHSDAEIYDSGTGKVVTKGNTAQITQDAFFSASLEINSGITSAAGSGYFGGTVTVLTGATLNVPFRGTLELRGSNLSIEGTGALTGVNSSSSVLALRAWNTLEFTLPSSGPGTTISNVKLEIMGGETTIVYFSGIANLQSGSSFVIDNNSTLKLLDDATVFSGTIQMNFGVLDTHGNALNLDGSTLNVASSGHVLDTYDDPPGVVLTKGSTTIDQGGQFSTPLDVNSGTTTAWNDNIDEVLTAFEGDIQVQSGATLLVPVGKKLKLSDNPSIDEMSGSTTIGTITTTRDCYREGIYETFGGLGIVIYPVSVDLRSTTVSRTTGTAPAISGVTTIKRYFDIEPSNNSGLNATLGFKYAESDLNGTTESNLQLYKSTDGGTSWSPQGGTVNTSADSLALTGIGSFSLWTAGHAAVSPPTLSNVSPSAAVQGTTLNVTLTGTNFINGGSSVSFTSSGITVNSVTFNSSTEIVANISLGSGAPTGLRNVSVTTSQGTATLTNGFEVVVPQNPLPSVVSITPNSGVRLQTITVTVVGGGFMIGLTAVSFGDGITVSSVTGNSTTLTVQIVIGASASLGSRTVTFTNPGPGGGTATRPGAFSVVNPAPGILGITPSNGARGRTVSVTLTGTEFVAGSTAVSAGSGISVDSVVAVSPTKITASFSIARSAATGSRDITVTNASPGGGTATLAGSFTVQNPSPTLLGMTPNIGNLGQTLNIVLSGSDFLSGASSVDFGSGIVVNSVTVDTAGTHLTANLTIGTGAVVGSRNVTVTNSAPGGGSMNVSGAFTVGYPLPTISSLSPAAGARGQTLNVTLAGTNFIAGVSSVSFGPGVTVNSVTVSTAGSLTANISIAPDAALASRSVVVTNSAPGGGSATLSFAFNVENAAPTIASVSPVSSSRGQVLNVTIIGTYFSNGTTSVSFGSGITVNSLSFNSLTQMVAAITVAPDATLGTRNVVVTNSSPGGGSATLSSAFSIQNPAPTLASLTPASGVRGQLVVAKLTGTNFVDGLTTADFGTGVTVNALVVASSTEASASLSISASTALGARDVSVTNPPPGGGTVTLSAAFTVANPLPTISSIVPASAGRGSVLNVVVTGTQFITSISSLGLGADISVSNLVVKSPTELQASITIAVTATAGARNVTVTNASPGGGSASLTNGFTITSGPATGIEGYIGDVPDQYILQEAYPNPFNPSTRIRYGIPEDSRIKLDVYNMLGNIVSELIDGVRSKGQYELQWHADNLPSGVYLVRLNAESLESAKRFIGSRKVVLVK